MNYLINSDIVKSHYAAKSYLQPSAFLVNILQNIENCRTIVDYGCGKLRYANYLIEKGDEVFFIDSKLQLERPQKIFNTMISVNKYVKNNFKNGSTRLINEIEDLYNTVDFILCSNVLSSIPYESVRLRVLSKIRKLLTQNGIALITTQYRNSRFTYDEEYKKKYFDGWLSKGSVHTSFYGIINPSVLLEYISKVNLYKEKILLSNGSAYIFVRKNFKKSH